MSSWPLCYNARLTHVHGPINMRITSHLLNHSSPYRPSRHTQADHLSALVVTIHRQGMYNTLVSKPPNAHGHTLIDGHGFLSWSGRLVFIYTHYSRMCKHNKRWGTIIHFLSYQDINTSHIAKVLLQGNTLTSDQNHALSKINITHINTIVSKL